MPVNITGSDAWTTPIVVPAAGEAVATAERQLSAQGQANQAFFLRKRMLGGVAASVLPQALTMMSNANSRFSYMLNFTVAHGIAQTSVADEGLVSIPCPHLPAVSSGGHILTAAIIGVIHTGAHGGAWPPAQMAALELYGQVSGAAPVLLGGQMDPSASAAAYESFHLISITGLAIPLETYAAYYLGIYGETGANAIIGFKVISAMLGMDPA